MISIFAIFVFTACQHLPYADKIPMAYYGTHWISENPYIYFDNPSDRTEGYLYGKAMTTQGEVDIAVDFGTFEPIIYIYILEIQEKEGNIEDVKLEDYIGECVLNGTCEYSADECIVNVDFDDLFNGKYETIVFTKQSLETETTE